MSSDLPFTFPKTKYMYSRQITLAADVPPYPRAMEIADEARQYCGIDGTGWLNQVQCLLQNGIHQQTENVEVQYFSLGDGCLCGVANEVMVEFALRVSELLHAVFLRCGTGAAYPLPYPV